MRTRNLPTIDAGYWAAIVAASICGTNTGDLAAGPLGLGHVRGILPLGAIFLAIIWAEKILDWTTVAFYWLAIIVLRTMATNIADFATHDLKLSYPVFVLLLTAIMGVMIWADRFRTDTTAQQVEGSNARLPTTDWSYWALMLAAGVLGTALGDWLADAGPGVYWASLIGMPFFVAAVWAAYRFGLSKTLVLDRHSGVQDLGNRSRRHARGPVPVRDLPTDRALVQYGDLGRIAHRHHLLLDTPKRGTRDRGNPGKQPLTVQVRKWSCP
jgi:uncharacterized membrane-anchored protein